MRLFFRLLVYATLLLVLAIVAIIGDLAFNHRRLLYLALGRDALVASCRPVLVAKLRAAGFEPDDIEFGGEPDIAFSTSAGKTLADTFTFEDGPSQARVDGTMACAVKDQTVGVTVHTEATPLRAT